MGNVAVNFRRPSKSMNECLKLGNENSGPNVRNWVQSALEAVGVWSATLGSYAIMILERGTGDSLAVVEALRPYATDHGVKQ